MKKALSLLLALSMVMSFFTVSAFAEDARTAADVVANVTVNGMESKCNYDKDKGELTVKYAYGTTEPELTNDSFTVEYAKGYDADGPVDYGAGKLTVHWKEIAETEETAAATVEVTVVFVPEAKYTAALNLSAPGSKTFAKSDIVGLPEGVTLTLGEPNETQDGITYEAASGGAAESAFGTFTITDATQVDSGSYTYTFTGEVTTDEDQAGMDATVTVTLIVTADTLNVNKTIINGSAATYSFAALKDEIADQLEELTSAKSELDVSKVTITVPSTSIFTLYKGTSASGDAATDSVELTSDDSLTVKATAGSIGTETLNITAMVGTKEYTGTLTLKSDYAGTVTVSQDAAFTKEVFCLDSINSTIKEVRAYSDSVTAYESSKVCSVTSYPVTPRSSDWTEQLIGYDSKNVAYRVNVNFTAAKYDLSAAAESGDAPFTADAFESFVDAVTYEQSWADLNNYYSTTLDYVQFYDTVSASGKWALKLGSAALKTTDKLNASNFDSVTISVTKAGTYDIPFRAYYKYQNTRTGSLASAALPYYGVFRIIAVTDGDIQYEVSYNQSVTFNAADFQSFYRTAIGSSTAKLDHVVFGDLPMVGTLYTAPGKYTSSYKATTTDLFYVSPTGSQLSLSKVTYAAGSSRDEYSVYIPFTAYGSGASKSGVVEIVVNSQLPFTDIGIDHTFYEYIKYVYNHNIMNGKTDTYFNATDPLTRVQLVVTLYRMSGSPSTYNNRTLPFSDTKGLSTEFANAVKWAVANKIVEGYADNTFLPNSAVSRQAMVTVLHRYAKNQGFNVGVDSITNLAGFKDSAKVSSKMVDAMNWAVEIGLLSGNAGYLNPTGSTTRGAAAKILANFHSTYIA